MCRQQELTKSRPPSTTWEAQVNLKLSALYQVWQKPMKSGRRVSLCRVCSSQPTSVVWNLKALVRNYSRLQGLSNSPFLLKGFSSIREISITVCLSNSLTVGAQRKKGFTVQVVPDVDVYAFLLSSAFSGKLQSHWNHVSTWLSSAVTVCCVWRS